MEIEYIIVQAGGKGTRMEYLTKNKPKALVPIDNLPMIFHLFKRFPNKKFIIITDYKSDVMRKYLEVFAKVNYLIIDADGKKGTCGGIKEAISKIPTNETPFMLIWSDLILYEEFELPITLNDYVGLSKTYSCRWSYKNEMFLEEPSTEYGVAGLFLFKSKDKLFEVPEEGEFVRWLQSKKFKMESISLDSSKEFGLISEWEKQLNNITDSNCRPFNKITVQKDLIIKEGKDEQGRNLATREKLWYEKAIEKEFKQIPKIYSFDPLTMEKINGHNVFQYSFSNEERKSILNNIINCLKELHNKESIPVDYFSVYEAYIGKTFKRLEKIRDLVPFTNQMFIRINGKNCRNIFFFKDLLIKYFEQYKCSDFKFLHGDNTFSNIMLNSQMTPILIDPRGYFGFTELYGDVAYDWAKLYYSIVGNYDQFNLKRFQLNIYKDEVKLDIKSNGWEEMENVFFQMIGNKVNRKDILIIHAIIWLSLTTYTWEDYDSICGAFYNGLYYLEDIL